MSSVKCPSCGAPVAANITSCKYCGEALQVSQQQHQQAPPPPQYGYSQQPPPPQYGYSQQPPPPPYGQAVPPQYGHMQPPPYQPVYYNRKNKVVAGLLAIFLGGFGIHKFYLGRIGWGVVYLLFCWTYIPSIIGFFEGLVYLLSNENNFHMKYSKRVS